MFSCVVRYVICPFFGFLVLVKFAVRILLVGNKFFYVKPRDDVPECLVDPSLGQHGNVKLKDVTLHYVMNGDPKKQLMLLIHGFPDFWYSWKHQLKEFAEEYCVVAVDLRGYGDSDKMENVEDYEIPRMADDMHRVIKRFANESGNAVIVCHDWGGFVSYYLAGKHPDVVKRMVLANAPHPRAFSMALRSSWTQFCKSWYTFMFQLPKLPEMYLASEDLALFNYMFSSGTKQLLSEDDMEAYKYVFSKPGALTHAVNYYRANLLSTTKQADSVKCPVMLVWGDGDVSLSMLSAVYTSLYVDQLSLRILKGACHWSHWDRPEEFNSLVRSFLDQPN